MLMLLSPSKTLDEAPCAPPVATSMPEFLEETARLHALFKRMKPADLQKLMGISDKLAALNHARFQSFAVPYPQESAKPALLMFRGDVYAPMQAETYDAATLRYAQAHLRILSGFYGLLRPLDLILPYRLEMGTRLANTRGKDLYAFWGDRLSRALNEAAGKQKRPLIVNLASGEYFKAVDNKALKIPVLTVQFKERKGDAYKVVGLMAKRARGLMADYILRNRIETVEGLKDFDAEGYRFMPSLSGDGEMVFTRP